MNSGGLNEYTLSPILYLQYISSKHAMKILVMRVLLNGYILFYTNIHILVGKSATSGRSSWLNLFCLNFNLKTIESPDIKTLPRRSTPVLTLCTILPYHDIHLSEEIKQECV